MLKLEHWPFANLLTKKLLEKYDAQNVLEKLLNEDYNFVPFKHPKEEHSQVLVYGLYINNDITDTPYDVSIPKHTLPLGGLQTSLITTNYKFYKHSFPMYFVNPRNNHELESIKFVDIKKTLHFEPKELDTSSIIEFKEYMVDLFVSIYERLLYTKINY